MSIGWIEINHSADGAVQIGVCGRLKEDRRIVEKDRRPGVRNGEIRPSFVPSAGAIRHECIPVGTGQYETA